MSRGRAASLAILAAALAFRLLLALALPNDEPDDGRLYARIGHNVLAHGVYSASEDAPWTPTYIRVPGYPLFLAAVYRVFGDGNNTAVRVAQAFVDTATCWLIACLAAAWTPGAWPPRARERTGRLALAIAAACPFTAIYVVTLLTETLAMFLGTLAVLLATRALLASRASASAREARRVSAPGFGAWAMTGAAAGAAALVRPELLLYAVAAGAALLIAAATTLPRRGWRAGIRQWLRRVVPAGLALTLGVIVGLTPWTMRNARTFGQLQPLNPRSVAMPGEFVAQGYERWVRTWIDHPRYVAPALFTVDIAPIRIDELPAAAFGSAAERSRVAALLAQYNAPPPDADPDAAGQLPPGGMTAAIDAAFAQLARERIAAHPLRYYLALPCRRALTLWLDTHADFYPFSGFLFPASAWDRDRQQQVWLPLFACLAAAWTIGGWIGAWRLAQHRDTRLWLLLAALVIVPRLALLAGLENPEPRYTVEFFPIVSALAAIAVGKTTAGFTRPSQPAG